MFLLPPSLPPDALSKTLQILNTTVLIALLILSELLPPQPDGRESRIARVLYPIIGFQLFLVIYTAVTTVLK